MVANSNYDIVSVFYLNGTLLTDLRKSFQSHVSSWFVFNAPGVENKPTTRLISDAIDFMNAKPHAREKLLLAR